MSIKQQIEDKLKAELMPSYLAVVNESHMHAVPANAETHFKVVIAASVFEGKRAVQRHQFVYGVLSEEMEGGVHALALHTFTPEEWQSSNVAPDSPECMGGGK
jgi:BolA family transcriptional regulator, general stress-responsive regulator